MSKRKIKLDLSGGWDEVLGDAININTGTFINAVFADRECVLRRNDRIYDILDSRKGDKISVTVLEIKAIFRMLLESIAVIQMENDEITDYASDCIDALHSYRKMINEIIDEYGLVSDGK